MVFHCHNGRFWNALKRDEIERSQNDMKKKKNLKKVTFKTGSYRSRSINIMKFHFDYGISS